MTFHHDGNSKPLEAQSANHHFFMKILENKLMMEKSWSNEYLSRLEAVVECGLVLSSVSSVSIVYLILSNG